MKKKTICFFGTYKANYTRNTILRDGLVHNGFEVIEANFFVADKRLELSDDYTIVTSLFRIFRKIKTSFLMLLAWKKIKESNAVFVLHPGHLDMPVAWLLTRIFNKPLYFDNSISPFDIMFVGRNLADVNSFKARIVWVAEKICLQLADKIIVDTLSMKSFLITHFSISDNKIIVLPLGANENMYMPKKNNKEKSDNKISVFFFGLFSPLHGLPFIMESIKLLKKEKNISFTILGDGYLKDELYRDAKKNKLINLKFYGFVPEKKLVQHIQKCDILLGVFSNSPTMIKVVPNKVFAGLACGKPVITARHPSTEGFFNHKENIYLCEPENAKNLASAIKTVATNKKLREKIAKNGYQLFLQKFSTKSIGKAIANELESVT